MNKSGFHHIEKLLRVIFFDISDDEMRVQMSRFLPLVFSKISLWMITACPVLLDLVNLWKSETTVETYRQQFPLTRNIWWSKLTPDNDAASVLSYDNEIHSWKQSEGRIVLNYSEFRTVC